MQLIASVFITAVLVSTCTAAPRRELVAVRVGPKAANEWCKGYLDQSNQCWTCPNGNIYNPNVKCNCCGDCKQYGSDWTYDNNSGQCVVGQAPANNNRQPDNSWCSGVIDNGQCWTCPSGIKYNPAAKCKCCGDCKQFGAGFVYDANQGQCVTGGNSGSGGNNGGSNASNDSWCKGTVLNGQCWTCPNGNKFNPNVKCNCCGDCKQYGANWRYDDNSGQCVSP
ncbi:hypothetical protein HDU80_006308 [Chytriomyces hyalinus]|nr:hypothetical protein HDU80_006308 [Chytriomyces hyalinus]